MARINQSVTYPRILSCSLTKACLVIVVLIIFLIFFESNTLHVKESAIEKKARVDTTKECAAPICGNKSDTSQALKDRAPVLNADSQDDESQMVAVARRISSSSNMVLFTVINEAYLPFTYSWLCNTKTMNVHQFVLIVTTDKQSKEKLNKDWPEINVILMDLKGLSGNQSYSHVGYIKITVKRTELIQSLLLANIDVFVFEVDCLWLANPIPSISFSQSDDIIVNPVSGSNNQLFASGFILLRSTRRAKILWQKVTDLMVALGKKVEKLHETAFLNAYEMENEQRFLARLIQNRYADVTLKILPLDLYADGKWYEMSEAKRSKLHPLVINNNWIIGNKAKIDRAKKWNHWFAHDDLTCDMDLVHKTIDKNIAVPVH